MEADDRSFHVAADLSPEYIRAVGGAFFATAGGPV